MCHHGHCSVNYLHCGLGNNACARYDIRPLILVVMRVSGPLNFSFGWNSETSNNEASDCSIIIYWLSIRNKITNWSGLTLNSDHFYVFVISFVLYHQWTLFSTNNQLAVKQHLLVHLYYFKLDDSSILSLQYLHSSVHVTYHSAALLETIDAKLFTPLTLYTSLGAFKCHWKPCSTFSDRARF